MQESFACNMIMKKILIILLMYKFEGVKTQEDPCRPIPFPMDISFDETSSQGSIIFTGSETNSTTQKWNITNSSPHVSLKFINQTYQLVLLQTVDLDVTNPNDVCNSGLEQFTQRVRCTTSQVGIDDERIMFKINPVNEYAPDAVKIVTIRILEREGPTPIFIGRMLDLFKDRDCPKQDPIISISKTFGETDASEYFIVNSTTGFLYQIKNFDYEETSIQCMLGKSGGNLNLTAKDGPHTVSTILNVTFVNKDDSPPVFVRSECSTTCYTCPVSDIPVNIHYFHQGIIKTDPSNIKALDTDTSPSKITYCLDVYPDKYKNNVKFGNGSFSLKQSFAIFTNFSEYYDFSVRVLLRATGSNDQISDYFMLTIYVTVLPIATQGKTTEPTTTPPITLAAVTSQNTILSTRATEEMKAQQTTTLEIRNLTAKFCHQTPDEPESAKDKAIIVLSISTGILLTVIVAFVFHKMWSARTKPESPNPGYEEVKRNNENKENVYATITL